MTQLFKDVFDEDVTEEADDKDDLDDTAEDDENCFSEVQPALGSAVCWSLRVMYD